MKKSSNKELLSRIAFRKVDELVMQIDGKVKTYLKLVVKDIFTPQEIIDAVTQQYGEIACVDSSHIATICDSGKSQRHEKNIFFVHQRGKDPVVCLASFAPRREEQKISFPNAKGGTTTISLPVCTEKGDLEPSPLEYFTKHDPTKITPGISPSFLNPMIKPSIPQEKSIAIFIEVGDFIYGKYYENKLAR